MRWPPSRRSRTITFCRARAAICLSSSGALTRHAWNSNALRPSPETNVSAPYSSIVIEDLHWSDDTSLEFLLHLERRIAAHRGFTVPFGDDLGQLRVPSTQRR